MDVHMLLTATVPGDHFFVVATLHQPDGTPIAAAEYSFDTAQSAEEFRGRLLTEVPAPKDWTATAEVEFRP